MQSTEQTKIVSLFQQWETRDYTNNFDVDAVNVLYEPIMNQLSSEQYFNVLKRDGCVQINGGSGTAGAAVIGMFYWKNQDLLLILTNQFIIGYFATAANFPVAFTTAVVGYSATDNVRFTEFLFDDGTRKVYFANTGKLTEVTAGGIVTDIVDPDLPTPHQPYPVFLDGYLFLADQKGNIWNSDLNNPTSWSPSNFLTAESYPDGIEALGRQGVYIVAYGLTSIEFFYDAANPTGSPLARYSSNTPRIGYRGGLADIGDKQFFVGVDANSKQSVYMLQGLKVQDVGNSAVARLLEQRDSILNNSSRFGIVLSINGHQMYTWIDPTTAGVGPTPNKVYAYDLDTKFWTRMVSPLAIANCDFPFAFAQTVETLGGSYTIATKYGTLPAYQFKASLYQDNGVNYSCQFTTKNEDFGTRRAKFGSRLVMVCDQTSSPSLMSISWSDNDFQSFSTPRTIDVSNVYPHLYALGSFRKRAHKITYSDNFPMRWQYIEMDYDQGSA